MKHIIAISVALLFSITSCGLTKIDPSKAQTHIENLLNDLKGENYSAIDNYYTTSFNESEPLEKKKEKYNRLKEVMGPIESYELLSSTQKQDEQSNVAELELVYKVTCKRVTAKETFLIINDEGELKIIFQNIENLK